MIVRITTAPQSGLKQDLYYLQLQLAHSEDPDRAESGLKLFELVPRVGVEPTRPYGQRILSP